MSLPSLFLSHGAPTILLDPSAARDFLSTLGSHIERPRAILLISAHHDARFEGGVVSVTSGAHPGTIHDFGGFPESLYRIRYPAPGAPDLAEQVASMVEAAGCTVHRDATRGFDHGAWTPLILAWPDADIPLVQLSIDTRQDAQWHLDLGRVLAPLRDEGVLIIGSGSMTHNLRAIFTTHAPVDAVLRPEAVAFTDWMAERMEAGALDDIVHAVERAPYGHDSHPTPDHFMPLPVALGAGMNDTGTFPKATRLHHSFTHGALAMDVYAFG